MTPADCDLRDFQFMPLDVLRLRDSGISVLCSGDEFRCAVLLWCAAWHQVPAASLPDDDMVLSQFAGFGRVVKEWKKVRAGALHGWVKCSDGRWYHPVVAEKAREAWLSKHTHAYAKLSERVRKANKQRAQKGLPEWQLPELHDWIGAGRPLERELFPPENFNLPAERHGASGGKPPGDEHDAAGIPAEGCSASGGKPPGGEHDAAGIAAERRSASGGKPPGCKRNAAGIPAENALKGQGQGQGYILSEDKKGELRKESERGKGGCGRENHDPPADAPVAAAGAATCPAGPPVAAPRGKRAASLPIPGVPDALLADWLAVRRAKRAGPVTQAVIDGLTREAAEAGMSVTDAVRLCCEAGWQGFRAEWAANRRSAASAQPNRQEAIEQGNRAVAQRWLRQQGATA
jgi:hypothetical protein